MTSERWTRVKELFHTALAHAPAERAGFLHAVCGGEDDLRAEVQRLLDAHGQAGSFIEKSPVATGAASANAFVALTGRVVGHYRVERLIGAGGMGEVYAARDLDLGREVALKVVTGRDAHAQGRLRREAQHASQLNHPHICTIHEVGTCDGQAFIVMEYVAGRPLSELLAEGALPVDAAVRYGIQIADALAHAHRHGLVHRDLKSANVVVTTDGRAKVLDFGLALGVTTEQITELSQSKDTPETLVAGTLPYMAPELLRGEQADSRSDIWALGVLLFEMAAGRKPFDGRTGFELSAAILHADPSPLSSRVPSSFQRIIRRCLQKDPAARYRDAGAVHSALEHTQTEALAGERSATVVRALLSFGRTRAALAVIVVALLIATGAAAWWKWTRVEAPPVAVGASGRPAIAVMSFDNVANAGETAWLSKGIPSMLVTSLAQTRGLDIVSTQRLYETARQIGQSNLESLDRPHATDVARRAGAGAVVVGSIVKAGSEIRIDAQVEDLSSGRVLLAASVQGTDLFSLIDQLAERIRGGIGFGGAAPVRGIADVASMSLEAYRLYALGEDAFMNARFDDAERAMTQAVSIDPTFAEAYLQLAFVSDFLRQPASHAEYLRKAIEHVDRLDDRHRLLAQTEAAREAGDAMEAARLLDALVAGFPDFESAYPAVGLLYQPVTGGMYDPGKAVAVIAKGVKALPRSASMLSIYAYALAWAGRIPDAAAALNEYARMAPREPNPYDSLGEISLMAGSPDQAVAYYSRALTIDPTYSNSHNGRAWSLAALGRYDEAIRENPPGTAIKGVILSRVGRSREAVHILDQARRDATASNGFADEGTTLLLSSVLAIERRDYPRALADIDLAHHAFDRLVEGKRRVYLVIADLLAGLAELRAGNMASARGHLETMQHRFRREVTAEQWWCKMLEGDINLADGHLDEAARAFAAGQPAGRMWANLSEPAVTLLANNLIDRDGAARVMKARGDLSGAADAYRRLTIPGEQKWMAMLEPRYILERARLLDQMGDTATAAMEYERFLSIWKDADADLPEGAEARGALARLRHR